ncbi:MAG: hypothetical protein Q9171_002026 [Xanthocarpia ochracea]
MPNPVKPEPWQWLFNLTWPDRDSPTPLGPEEIRKNWLFHAKKLVEPSRSVCLEIAPTATIWCDRLAEWRAEPWDRRHGKVTLAGNAAHPMTYHGKPLADVLDGYKNEVQKRGGKAVVSSGENPQMVHEWERLKQSSIFTIGMKALVEGI